MQRLVLWVLKTRLPLWEASLCSLHVSQTHPLPYASLTRSRSAARRDSSMVRTADLDAGATEMSHISRTASFMVILRRVITVAG